VAEANQCKHGELGALLRREGLYYSQITAWRKAAASGVVLSMGSTRNCFDNAAAESFFATVKLEAVQERVHDSHQHARQHLFGYIEVFYNRQRLHSSLNFQCPGEFAA
jgi:putative transposase